MYAESLGCLPEMHKTNGPPYDFIHTGDRLCYGIFNLPVMYSLSLIHILHGSTQMSVQSLDGARRLAALGFTRVILALSLIHI